MAYTTKDEIQADFKDTTFDSTSNVKDTEVTQFIVEADSLINSYVSAKYVVPVTAGEGLQTLKLFSRCLVTARIKKLLEVKQEKNSDANQNVVGVFLSPTQIIKMLENIRDDKMPLVGATPVSTRGGFYNKNVADDISPVINKDEKQW